MYMYAYIYVHTNTHIVIIYICNDNCRSGPPRNFSKSAPLLHRNPNIRPFLANLTVMFLRSYYITEMNQ